MPYLTEASDGSLILHLHIQPRGAKSRIVGLHDERLKISIASPPVDGKANKEVVKFLSTLFKVNQKNIVLKAGLQSRKKTVVITSISSSAIREIVQTFL